MGSKVHSLLHLNFHHQISYTKFYLKLHYLPPFEREIWNYGKGNVDHIRKAITEFPSERKFENNSVDEKVNIFNANIENILPNYIPHKTIKCDDRDAPWINKNIKQLIPEKKSSIQSYPINPFSSLTIFSVFKQR